LAEKNLLRLELKFDKLNELLVKMSNKKEGGKKKLTSPNKDETAVKKSPLPQGMLIKLEQNHL